MKDRSKGLLIILTGVLIISPDAVLTRFMNEGGADPWTTVFWKMLFAAPVSTSFAIYEAGGPRPMWKSIVDARAYYAVVMPLQAALDTCFVLSFFYTTAANALLLINLNPLWCAIAGRLLLGDILPHRTYIALVLALGSVLVIFVPQILDRNNDNQDEFDVDLDLDLDLDLGEQTITSSCLWARILWIIVDSLSYNAVPLVATVVSYNLKGEDSHERTNQSSFIIHHQSSIIIRHRSFIIHHSSSIYSSLLLRSITARTRTRTRTRTPSSITFTVKTMMVTAQTKE